MDKPKVLILDIETAPIEAYIWDLKEQYVSVGQIIKDWNVIAWAAKWLDAPASEVVYQDQRNVKSVRNDKELLQDLWKLLDEADIVVTQNGRNFDGPKLNARFIMHGMRPPSPYRHLDTYQIVKNVAKFTSNSLEYLTDKLCTKYKKLSHSKFPGLSLWKECLNGNKEAWKEMEKYNIHDVLATEELYNKIKAWAPQNAPKLFNLGQTNPQCRTCGGKTEKRGPKWVGKKQVQSLHCTSQLCGAWDVSPLAVVKKAA